MSFISSLTESWDKTAPEQNIAMTQDMSYFLKSSGRFVIMTATGGTIAIVNNWKITKHMANISLSLIN